MKNNQNLENKKLLIFLKYLTHDDLFIIYFNFSYRIQLLRKVLTFYLFLNKKKITLLTKNKIKNFIKNINKISKAIHKKYY
jgi:hypothetical protein